jgi:KUP system potassium uptake protein
MSASSNLKPTVERRALRASGFALAILSFQTLGTASFPSLSHHSINDVVRNLSGIIYSDIGTSPLYVLNGIWPASGPVPPEDDVIGGLSAIVWSLTLLPLLKYVRALFCLLSLQEIKCDQVFICLRFGTYEGLGCCIYRSPRNQ